MSLTGNFNTDQIRYVIDQLGIKYSTKPTKNGWQTISSPLREDKNPSFRLDIYEGAWIDNGTGKKGDLVNLVMEVRDMTTAESMRWIKKVLGLNDDYFRTSYNHNSYKEAFKFLNEEYQTAKTSAPKQGKQVPNKENNKFECEAAHQRLKDEAHKLVDITRSYDLIDKATLLKYDCGITEQYGKDWLSIPYGTGTQLYRRNDGVKVIRMLKGSKPSNSFFGLSQVSGKGTLLIAKSPREAMMLNQRYEDIVDVISIASGETDNISEEQAQQLKKIAGKTHVIKVLFDCDTNKAHEITKSFTKAVANIVPNRCKVEYINVWALSEQACKDMNEYFKKYSNQEQVYKDVISKGTDINKRKPAPKDIFNHMLDVDSAKPHSSKVYENLPRYLKEVTDLIEEDYHCDVFLNSSLPIFARHFVNVSIPHNDRNYSPDLYTMVIAKPGSGKGIADKARGLGKALNDHLIEESKQAKAAWECLSKERREQTTEPPLRQFYLPGNSSSRALYDFLMNNNSKGLIFETEIDTLINASRQDWGDFTDIIRKAFHHEPLSIQRKGEEMYIDRPQLSIFMSGTFDQFRGLFDSAENGHFSRYALYTFEAPLKWISHRPTEKSKKLDLLIENLSEKLFSIRNTLIDKDEPLKIHLKESHWNSIDEIFREKMNRLEQEEMSRYLQSSNQRAAIIALRIAAILCVLREATEGGPEAMDKASLTISDEDLTAALYLANNYLDHAIRLFQLLPGNDQKHSKGTKFESFYNRLPDQFETKQAYYIGIDVGVSKRTVRNYLQTFLQNGSLRKIEYGKYEKS